MTKSQHSRNMSRIQIGAVLAMSVLGITSLPTVPLTRSAFATTYDKANNQDNLNLTTSWATSIVPSSGDIARFGDPYNSTVSGFLLGAVTSWQGLVVRDTTGGNAFPRTLSILGDTGSGFTLSMGLSGIDTTATTSSTLLDTGLILTASQTWNIGGNNSTSQVTIGSVGSNFNTGSGILNINNNRTTSTGGSGLLINSGSLTGSAAINMSGGFTTVSSNIASYTGNVTLAAGLGINSGSLTFSGNNNSGNQNYIVNSGVLTLSGSNINTSGNRTLNSGTMTVSGNNQTSNANYTLSGGLMTLGAGDFRGWTGALTLNGGNLVMSGNFQSNNRDFVTSSLASASFSGDFRGWSKTIVNTSTASSLTMGGTFTGWTGSASSNGPTTLSGGFNNSVSTVYVNNGSPLSVAGGTWTNATSNVYVTGASTVTNNGGAGTGLTIHLSGNNLISSTGGTHSNGLEIIGNNTFNASAAPTYASSGPGWFGNGTMTLIIPAAAGDNRWVFQVTQNTSTNADNPLSNFTGLITIPSKWTDAATPNKRSIQFNTSGGATSSGYFGNSVMGIDAGGERITLNGVTLTVGYIQSTSNVAILGGSNTSSANGSKFIIGNPANPLNRTFAGSIADFNQPSGTSRGQIVNIVKLTSNTLSLTNTTSGLYWNVAGGNNTNPATSSQWSGLFAILDGTVEYGHANLLGSGNATANSDGVIYNASLLGADKMILGDTNGTNTSLNYIGGQSSTTTRLFTTNANSTSTVTLSASGTNLGANIIWSHTGSILMAGNPTMHFGGTNAGLNTFNPQLSGSGGLLKDGPGNWLLGSSQNSYSGATNVTGGGLYLNSPDSTMGLNSTSSLTVNGSGAILGGIGAVNGLVTITNGQLDPGIPSTANSSSGLGTLFLKSGLSMATGTSIRLNLDVAANDTVNVNNANLALTGNISFTVYGNNNSIPWASAGSYPIFTNINVLSATLANGVLTGLTNSDPDPITEYKFIQSGNTVFLKTVTDGSIWNGAVSTDWNTSGNWVGGVPGLDAGGGDGASMGQIATNFTATVGSTIRTLAVLGMNTGSPGLSYTVTASSGKLIMNSGTKSAFASIVSISGNNSISAPVELDVPTKVNVYPGSTLTISGVISNGTGSANDLTFQNFGIATIAGNNTYTGNTTIPVGFGVFLGNGGTAGTFGDGTASSAVINSGSATINHSGTFSLLNSLSGSGSWAVIGGGTTTLSPTPSNFTFSQFGIASAVVDAAVVNFNGQTTVGASGVLNANQSLISGPLAVSGGTVNQQNAQITANVTMTSGAFNTSSSTSNALTGTKTISGGVLTYNAPYDNQSTLTLQGNGTLQMNGNSLQFDTINGNSTTATINNSGAAAELRAINGVQPINPSTNQNYSGNITGNIAVVGSISGSVLGLAGNNTYNGGTRFDGNTDASIVVWSSTALPAGTINFNGQPTRGGNDGKNGAIQIGPNVNLTNNIVINNTMFNGTTGNIIGGPKDFGGSKTFSGNLTTFGGSTTVGTELGVRISTGAQIGGGNGGPPGSLTLTGKILTNDASSTGPLMSTGVLFHNGFFILNSATVNTYTSEFIMGGDAGGGNSGSRVTLNGTALMTSNVGSGSEGGALGNAVATVNTLTLNDTSKIDIGLANFNMNRVAGAGSSNTMSANTGTVVSVGGFTKTGGTATIDLEGGKLIATRDNSVFMPASINALNVDDGIIDTGGFNITIASPIGGLVTGNVNVQGASRLTLTGSSSFLGTMSIANTTTVQLGDGGATGSFGLGNINDSGTMAFFHNRTDGGLVVLNQISGTGKLAQLGGDTLTLAGLVNLTNGTSTVTSGLLVFGGASFNHAIGDITGNGSVTVDNSGGGVTLSSGAIKLVDATNINSPTTGQLSVNLGSLTLRSGAPAQRASIVNGLTLSGSTAAWSGVLDVSNTAVVVENANATVKATMIAQLQEQISSYPTVFGGGITSSAINGNNSNVTRLVVVDNADVQLTSFRGITTGLNSNSVIVGAAHVGDTNLDGKVNLTDLVSVGLNWNKTSGATWGQGDFVGSGGVGSAPDGKVILADLVVLGLYWSQDVSVALVPSSLPPAGGGGLGGGIGGSSAVPEPTSLALLALGGAALLARRRRRI